MCDVLAPMVLGNLASAYVLGSPASAAGRSKKLRRRLPRIVLASVAAAAAAVVAVVTVLVSGGAPTPASGSESPRVVAHTARPVPASADVALTLTGNLFRGRGAQLGITVLNMGPSASGLLTVVITLPTGATLVAAPAGQWECTGRTTTLVCSHPSLGRQGSASGVVSISIGPVAALGGRASAVVSPSTKDPRTTNNRSSTAAGVLTG